ncbi:hypothetical protein JCM10212_001411 [Sporobolomyces blumeae]
MTHFDPLEDFVHQLHQLELSNARHVEQRHEILYAVGPEINRIAGIIDEGQADGHGAQHGNPFFADPIVPHEAYRNISAGTTGIFERRTGETLAIVAPEALRERIKTAVERLRRRHSQAEASLSRRSAARYGIDRAGWTRENNRF